MIGAAGILGVALSCGWDMVRMFILQSIRRVTESVSACMETVGVRHVKEGGEQLELAEGHVTIEPLNLCSRCSGAWSAAA